MYLLVAGIAIFGLGFGLSVIFALKEFDMPSTGTPNALFVGGAVVGGGLALWGIVLLVRGRHRG